MIVVLSAIFTWKFGWDKKGLAILGNIESKGRPFPARFPLQPSHLAYASDAFSTSFVIALLGFFESSVAAKSLGVGEATKGNVFKNMNLSPNRELVALGVANIIGGVFMALPAFGGYGRSKVNASTGGRTPVSSIVLSLITVVCVLFVMPYFYYLPVSVSILPTGSILNHITESGSLCHDQRRGVLPSGRNSTGSHVLH